MPPAGSEGLFFLPWLEGSATPHPDARARGGWMGLTLRHTKAHLVRSLMEGVAFDLKRSLECFEDIGLPIEDLRIGEGGARSALWRQIQADVFGRDVRVLEVQDASALGAAVIAGVGVGVFPDFEAACERSVKLGEAVRSGAKRAAELREAVSPVPRTVSEPERLVSRESGTRLLIRHSSRDEDP